MITPSDIFRKLLHRLGVAGPARVRAFPGTGAPKISGFPGRRAAPAIAALALAALVFSVTPAFAEHVYTPPPFGSGPISGVAVTQETGNVFYGTAYGIGETSASGGSPAGEAHGFVFPEGRGPAGYYAGTAYGVYGVAVDNACWYREKELGHALTEAECAAYDPSNGDIYFGNAYADAVQKFALDALTDKYEVVQEFPGGGIAVDEQGNVYIASGSSIFEFNEEGKEVATIKEKEVKNAEYVAVGAPGVVYVGGGVYGTRGYGEENVTKLVVGSKDEVTEEKKIEEQGFAVAVDEQGGAYVDNGSSISEFNPAGKLVGTFGASGEGAISSKFYVGGVVVNDATGQVYVSSGDGASSAVIELFDEVVVPGPAISAEQVTGVEATVATLQASIDPNKSPTTYRFEYDTTPYPAVASHGTSLPSHGTRVPEANASVGTGESPVPVSAQLTGLQPGTTYYYRVVAVSEVKPDEPEEFAETGKTFTTNAAPVSTAETCPNAQLRSEQPYGLTLPDCRAYEIVSPLDKNGSDAVKASYDATRSSLSGEAVTYQSPGIFAGSGGSQLVDQYIARRGPDGWTDQGITPPYVGYVISLANAYPAMAFTPELSAGIALTDTPLTGESIAGYKNLYLADFAATPVSYQLLTPKPTISNEGNPQFKPEVLGVTSDLSNVVYSEAAAGGGVYEWVDGTLYPLAGAGGGGGEPGADPGYGQGVDSWRSVSDDGSRVFFNTGEVSGFTSKGRKLFVEENPTSPTEACSVAGDRCVLEISKSQRNEPDPLGPGSARFRGASVNGSRVFFTDCSKLTKDATAVAPETETTCDPSAKTGNDLYEYDLETGELTDLTAVTEAEKSEDPLGAKVVGVPYISESGEYVYFVAEGTLTGANAEGKGPVAGEPNLYVAHLEGGSWTTSFIATLAPSTGGDTGAEPPSGGDSDDWNQISPLDSVRATPDGRRLAFLSQRSLTGYDNQQAETGECERNEEPTYSGGEGGACREVFSYDAVSQRLVCASCNPSGARPVGSSSLEAVGVTQEYSSEREGYTPRNFSENGGRLFFDSDDALVPHDRNGKQDVYEWEQHGEGSCQKKAACIFPISNVTGNAESFFLDADPQGENVFFATADQLVPADTDTHVDVYDARVGGGFHVTPALPDCDNAESCKPSASPQPPIFGAPGSATFSGPGNTTSTPVAAVTPKKKTAAEIKAEQLAKALRQCKKEKSKKKRETCEKSAKKKYGTSKPGKAKKSAKGRR